MADDKIRPLWDLFRETEKNFNERIQKADSANTTCTERLIMIANYLVALRKIENACPEPHMVQTHENKQELRKLRTEIDTENSAILNYRIPLLIQHTENKEKNFELVHTNNVESIKEGIVHAKKAWIDFAEKNL